LSEWHLAAVWQAAKKKPHKYGDDLLPILPRRKKAKKKTVAHFYGRQRKIAFLRNWRW